MNPQNPRPRFRPGGPLHFRAPGKCTPMMSPIDLSPTILDKRRADEVEAFRVEPAMFESAAVKIGRNLADDAIAYYPTASRAFRQGALTAAVAALLALCRRGATRAPACL